MSTDTRRGRTRARRGRAYLGAFALVTAALVVLGAAAAAIGVAQGPRVTGVQVDPDAAISASGSRMILETSQSLAEVDAAQVTVAPDVPFAVDTSGRSVGIRFGLPLRDDTAYTVEIAGLRGLGGGPVSDVVQEFRTPPLELFLLQRGTADGDTVFRTDLEGTAAASVFTHAHIEDFRATTSHLVMSVRTDDDRPALIVTDLDGQGARELPLPAADGIVAELQASDRGETIGYTFTDADLSADGGRESALFTASLATDARDAATTRIEVSGADPRIADWRFVPDTDSILLLGFDGSLLLTSSAGGEGTLLGTALAIDGIAGTDALVERIEGKTVVDLTDGSESALVTGEGVPNTVLPIPGGGTLRSVVLLDDSGVRASGIAVDVVADDGTATAIAEVAPDDALVQTCVSPSGRYAALLVAPDAVANPYDRYLLPLPERLETRVVEIATGEQVVALSGFDVSWCRVPPA